MRADYLLNAPVLTSYGQWTFTGPIDCVQARALACGAVSAVGHEDTARFIESILETPIPCVRRDIRMRPGERALVFRLLRRQAEGEILDFARLEQEPYEFALLERIK